MKWVVIVMTFHGITWKDAESVSAFVMPNEAECRRFAKIAMSKKPWTNEKGNIVGQLALCRKLNYEWVTK